MFKKLRNRLLLTNLLITAALITGCFAVIFIMMERNVTRNIDMSLNAALNMITDRPHSDRPEGPELRDEQLPAGHSEESQEAPPQEGEAPLGGATRRHDGDPFSSILMYSVDDSGNVTDLSFGFTLTDETVLEEINVLIPQIAAEGRGNGRVSVDGTVLEYKTRRYANGCAVALGVFNAEHGMLQRLLIVLILIEIFALGLALLISLISANRSIRPVEDSYNKQKQFVADASHELKTPLTTINTNIDVLLSHEDSLIRDEKKWLLYIKTESERMAKLTNDLLYLARLDHGESIIYGETSFSEAAESVLLAMEAVAFERSITIDERIDEGVNVKASPDQLRQLVMILMDNAIKYTPKGGRISVTLNGGRDAVLKVRNSGTGIDKEDMKQIFERFYRSDKSRARESGGYGLGLAIAKAITESVGGEISVSSKRNEYTEFAVSIPSERRK